MVFHFTPGPLHGIRESPPFLAMFVNANRVKEDRDGRCITEIRFRDRVEGSSSGSVDLCGRRIINKGGVAGHAGHITS